MARMQRSLFAQLNALAEEISQSATKTAAEKSAGPVPADPGGYQGASSHPSADMDNDVQKATTGARAAEYETDLKKQQGPVGVDSTPEMSQDGRQNDVQLNIGTHASAVGEDPAVEHDYKGDKDDPGTAHPAKTNDGEKYSSVSFKAARDNCSRLGNDILASLINASEGKTAGEMPAFLKKKKTEPEAGKLKGDQHKLDTDNDGKIEGSDLAALRGGKEASFKAGYELAAALGLNKEAAEASVREVCAGALRDADEMADLFIGFVSGKQAGADPTEEAAEGEDHSAPDAAASGASDAPAGGDAPAGLEAMMGGEGAPEAGLDAGGEGGGGDEAAVQELAMALEELGIPPEALIQALSQGGGEAGGAPAPEAAMAPEMAPEMGAPPEMAPKMAAARDLNDIGHIVLRYKREGKFQVKEARTKRSRELRDNMKQHIIELLSR
jgi:hypothetical protein